MFFKKAKERFEEVRREDLSPSERQMEDYLAANEKVTSANQRLSEIGLEYNAMNQQFGLKRVWPGRIQLSRGNFEDVRTVTVWWEDFKVREDAAIAEFQKMLQLAAALKPISDISVNHLDGTENKRSYK